MRELKGIKIGKHYIEKPIIQGGMGVGISWDQLAGNVSKNGGLGTISAICTGYYQNMKFVKKEVDGRPLGTENAYSREALFEIFKNARQICGDKPLACNILHAINDYERVVNDALEAGANIIVTGAGLPLELPRLTENYPDVEIVPIVSSARALKIICKKWKAAGRTPGAVIVEGPKSGGHQGAKYDELFAPEHQLEAILPPIKEERDKWGDFPIIAAGGIWDRDDIEKIMDLGADAVQMGTRFIGTHECDASPVLKQVLLDSKEEDIVIVSSPVGYPGIVPIHIAGNVCKMKEINFLAKKYNVSVTVFSLVIGEKGQEESVTVSQTVLGMHILEDCNRDSFSQVQMDTSLRKLSM